MKAAPCFQPHAAQDGLSAVVAGSHCDALLVERDSNIFGANVIENERHHAGLFRAPYRSTASPAR
jgi:hypothetical protein